MKYIFIKQGDPEIQTLDVGDAIEVNGHGTGGAVADMDGDGQVELLLSHGESASEPLTMYSVTEGNSNNYIRYVCTVRIFLDRVVFTKLYLQGKSFRLWSKYTKKDEYIYYLCNCYKED